MNNIAKPFFYTWLVFIAISGVVLDGGWLTFSMLFYLFHVVLVIFSLWVLNKFSFSPNIKGVVIAAICFVFVVAFNAILRGD